MVADRLDAQMQLVSDLMGRTAVLEHSQHLGLARCQVRMRGPRRNLLDVRHLAEHADDVIAAHERNRAQVDAEPVAVRADQHDLRVPRPVRPRDVLREDLARAPRLLGSDDRRELAPPNVADEAPRALLSQRMMPCRSMT